MALGVRPATRVHVHTRTTQYALCCSQQDMSMSADSANVPYNPYYDLETGVQQ